MTDQEHLQVQQNLFDIYCGILFNNQVFASSGERAEFTYDFTCPEYKTLIEKYGIDKIAGEGTAFERSVRLLHWMSPRLAHDGNYDNHVPANALDLLEYSLEKPQQGINCVNKAKILVECCLALGIHARRTFLMPCSPYDFDNHVVAEVYLPEEARWVMQDPSVNGYFVDKAGRALSLLDLRERFARQRFAALLTGEDSTGDLPGLVEKHMDYNAYFAKNLFRISADCHNTFGVKDYAAVRLTPAGYSVKDNTLANISYRLERFPAGKGWLEKWRAQTLEEPEPASQNVELFTAPPQ